MKKFLLLPIIFLVLSGCYGAQKKMSPVSIRNIKTLAIVPIESPPLVIDPFMSMDYIAPNSAYLITAPSQSLQMVGYVSVIVSGIYLLAELPEATKRSAKVAESIENILDRGGAWIPSIAFARETAKQISANEKYDVVLMQNVQKYPGLENGERTSSMRTWLKATSNWYNEEISQFSYKSFTDQNIDAVLEVGIYQYVILKDRIALGLILKLVDPMTGHVLGRARVFEESLQKTKEILDDNAYKFKEAFSNLGAELINKNLRYIGLTSE